MTKNPFQIDLAYNETMKKWDVHLVVGGCDSEQQAKEFAEVLADWMAEGSGWKARIQ